MRAEFAPDSKKPRFFPQSPFFTLTRGGNPANFWNVDNLIPSMKRFLLLPSCALLAFGMLTSCQKEEKSAHQLAEELTTELQKVTDYSTAEAVAPRIEALNKRFQNASVRVFSGDTNALAASDANAYSDAVCRLVREMGRVQASKPVTEADGEVDDASLVCAVGVGAGVSSDAPSQDQFNKGQLYIYSSDSESNNNPPAFAEYYGSAKLASALAYVASTADNGAFKMATEEDVPAIPEAVEVERASAPDTSAPAEDDAAADEPAAEDDAVADEPAAEDDAVVADDSADVAADDDMTVEETTEEATEEPSAEEEPADDAAASDEEVSDELGDDMGDDMGMDDIEF